MFFRTLLHRTGSRNGVCPRISRIVVLLSLVLLVGSCGLLDDDDGEFPPPFDINPKLERFFYWGYVGIGQWEPNRGLPIGDVRNPIWTEPDRIMAVTATRVGGGSIQGIFELFLAPDSLDFQRYVGYEFPFYVWSLGYDTNRRKPMIIYVDETSRLVAADVSLTAGEVVIDTELVEPEWVPQELCCWHGRPGVVFYGRNPTSGVAGFYWRHETEDGERTDELLYQVTIDLGSAQGLSISADGGFLLFGAVRGQYNNAQSSIYRLTLAEGSSEPVVIAQRKGALVSLRSHPVDPAVLLVNYRFLGDSSGPPQDHVELLDVESLASVDLNMRTSPSPYVNVGNGLPDWSPNGRDIVFSAWETDGLGTQTSPKELWLYKAVP
jgi:hypothetical protein